MLKTLFTPFTTSTQKQSVATMMVTSHDINFVMGFIKEEDMFSSANASMPTRTPTAMPMANVSFIKSNLNHSRSSFDRVYLSLLTHHAINYDSFDVNRLSSGQIRT